MVSLISALLVISTSNYDLILFTSTTRSIKMYQFSLEFHCVVSPISGNIQIFGFLMVWKLRKTAHIYLIWYLVINSFLYSTLNIWMDPL